LVYYSNIIVMQFMGNLTLGLPYPLLKDLKLKKYDLNVVENIYEEIIKNYRKIIKAGLVHGDLSEYNILIDSNNKPHFIDFSQGTIKKSTNFYDLLKRDVEKISNFFSKFIDVDFEKTAKELGVWNKIKNL